MAERQTVGSKWRLGFVALGCLCWSSGCSVPIAVGLDESDANHAVVALEKSGVAADKERSGQRRALACQRGARRRVQRSGRIELREPATAAQPRLTRHPRPKLDGAKPCLGASQIRGRRCR